MLLCYQVSYIAEWVMCQWMSDVSMNEWCVSEWVMCQWMSDVSVNEWCVSEWVMCHWISDVSVNKWEMWMTYYIDNWLCVIFIVYTSLSSYFYSITYWFSSAYTSMIFNSLSQQSHVSWHLFFLIVNFRYSVLEVLFNASFINLLFINLLFINLLFINLLIFYH